MYQSHKDDIFSYDPVTGTTKLIQNENLELYAHYTVQIGSKLYAYCNRAPSFKVIENLEGPQVDMMSLPNPIIPRSEPSMVAC